LSRQPRVEGELGKPPLLFLMHLVGSLLVINLIREIRARLEKIFTFMNLAWLQSVPGEPPSSVSVDQG